MCECFIKLWLCFNIGTIPSSIGQLTKLTFLAVNYNKFLGNLILFSIIILQTVIFTIIYNWIFIIIIGSLSSEIGQLTLLKVLYMNSNSFIGKYAMSKYFVETILITTLFYFIEII